MKGSTPNRAQRLLGGWSANLVQLALGMTQQIVLVPIFLHFHSGEMLAAWLAAYAAGNLAYIADLGLQSRVINRFLSFKSSLDDDGRTASYYRSMQQVYFGFSGILILLTFAGAFLVRPSVWLGFHSVTGFDAAFVVMVVAVLLAMPANVTGALYRARGRYGRAVWIVCIAAVVSQLGQVAAIATTSSLIWIALAYSVPFVGAAAFVMFVDAHRLFPFLHRSALRPQWAWRWTAGQFRRAFPFAVAGSTEIALQNLPLLLVSAMVADRMAVAQWGLTRVVAGLVRSLCVQATLPLAAELGHDYAVGAKPALRRLYASGSAFVTLLAATVVSGLLAFWSDFFALWTHSAVPYDGVLAVTLLIGAELVAPAMFALGYGYYSNRGELLARSKGLQIAAFLILSVVLIPRLGALGAAIAIVATDLMVQFGLLAVTVVWQTLERPVSHLLFVAALELVATVFGWALGIGIHFLISWPGLIGFAGRCGLWLAVVALVGSPLLNGRFRTKLVNIIPK